MSSPDVFTAFRNRLEAQWSDTPLIFENEDTQTPVDADSAPAPFVFVEIFGDDLRQESIGAPGQNMWLETGFTYLHVMVPTGTGSLTARTYARKLANLFREKPLGDVYIRDMGLGAGEPSEVFPNYWAMTVTIAWDRRDINTP